MSGCWRCDDIGQCETRTEDYSFQRNGKTWTKRIAYFAPCGVCERGQTITQARLREGLRGDRKQGVA